MKFLIIAFLNCILAVCLINAEEETGHLDLSRYSQTAAFRVIAGHTNAFWHLHQEADALVISIFTGVDDTIISYSVAENGQEQDSRDVYNWASQAEHSKILSEANLKNLHLAIAALPTQSATPPIDRLAIVSFREGTNWQTRTYDQIALPEAMNKIYEIIGERFETKVSKEDREVIKTLVQGQNTNSIIGLKRESYNKVKVWTALHNSTNQTTTIFTVSGEHSRWTIESKKEEPLP